MPAERTDLQSVRAPQIVRKSPPDAFLDSAPCRALHGGYIVRNRRRATPGRHLTSEQIQGYSCD
jgi:hypothetical protein